MESPFSIEELHARLRAEGVDDLAVSIDGSARDETYCLVEEPAGWQFFYSKRGRRNSMMMFSTFIDAAAHFLAVVLQDSDYPGRPVATGCPRCRLTRRRRRTDGSVASLPLPPAAERQYRWADEHD